MLESGVYFAELSCSVVERGVHFGRTRIVVCCRVACILVELILWHGCVLESGVHFIGLILLYVGNLRVFRRTYLVLCERAMCILVELILFCVRERCVFW